MMYRDGGQGRDRTAHTRIFSPLLYQLSYLADGCYYTVLKSIVNTKSDFFYISGKYQPFDTIPVTNILKNSASPCKNLLMPKVFLATKRDNFKKASFNILLNKQPPL